MIISAFPKQDFIFYCGTKRVRYFEGNLVGKEQLILFRIIFLVFFLFMNKKANEIPYYTKKYDKN